MKKIFSAILFTLVITSSFSQVKSADLSKDENFINYVNNFNTMLDYINTSFPRNIYMTIKTEIDNVKNQNLPYVEELKAVAKILKYSDVNQLGILINNIAINHNAFRKKYGEIKNDVFLDSYSSVTKNSSSYLPSSATFGGGCGWRFALCAAAAGVEGALILSACEAVTAGIGTPACVAGALVWAANEVAKCRESYCDAVPN